MSTVLEQIDWDAMILSIQETLFMTFFSLLIAVVLGFGLGIILYVTKDDGLYPNKIINRILDFIVNLLRAVPFIILIIILLPQYFWLEQCWEPKRLYPLLSYQALLSMHECV